MYFMRVINIQLGDTLAGTETLDLLSRNYCETSLIKSDMRKHLIHAIVG